MNYNIWLTIGDAPRRERGLLRSALRFAMQNHPQDMVRDLLRKQEVEAVMQRPGNTSRYAHDCPACTFLGRQEEYDLYVCPLGTPGGGIQTVIARYGDDGSEYTSGLISDHPALIEAARRARKMMLFNEEKLTESQKEWLRTL